MSVDWFVHGFETDRYAQELSDAILATGNQIHLVQLPPFSAELPEPPTKPFVLYGGTRIIEAAALDPIWSKGVWYNPEFFRWSWQAMLWEKPNMLMQQWYIGSFDIVHKFAYGPDERIFVRPDADLKEFAGGIMTFGDLVDWQERIDLIKDEPGVTITPDTKVIIGDVIEIAREWRVFVVDRKPVDCSRYRSYGNFDPVQEFPEEVRDFVNDICDIYLPAPVIVIDVGVTPEGRYGVIEANCFNSSGWYNVDINKVVAVVSEFAALTQW